MKRLIVAAGLNAAVLLALAPSSLAATVTFTGIVDEIQGHSPGVAIGDTFSGIFFFDPESISGGGVGGSIGKYSITAGEFTVSGRAHLAMWYLLQIPARAAFCTKSLILLTPCQGTMTL